MRQKFDNGVRKRITINMTVALHRAFKKEAVDIGATMSDVVEKLIEAFVKNAEERRANDV